MKHYIDVEGPATELCSEAGSELSGRSGDGSCDCPAHVHDKELPLELVNTVTGQQSVNYGYSSHFDF